ncbi:hypothetical protein E2320_009405 [Naja naja]|nr:hypothetical protein E2320_009405 [Naja naja]
MPTSPGKGAQSPGGTHGSTSLPEVAEKAGICPQAGLERPNGNCTEECQSDARCKGNQKCCRTGCGTSCRIPDGIPRLLLMVPAALQLVNLG